jgi:hypothetical protein
MRSPFYSENACSRYAVPRTSDSGHWCPVSEERETTCAGRAFFGMGGRTPMHTDRPIPPLTVTPTEHETLERWACRAKTAQAVAQRAHLILGCAPDAPALHRPGGHPVSPRRLREPMHGRLLQHLQPIPHAEPVLPADTLQRTQLHHVAPPRWWCRSSPHRGSILSRSDTSRIRQGSGRDLDKARTRRATFGRESGRPPVPSGRRRMGLAQKIPRRVSARAQAAGSRVTR